MTRVSISTERPTIDLRDRTFWRDRQHDAWTWCRANDPVHRDEQSGIWWHRDEGSGNLLVHGCHPNAARRGQFTDLALERAVLLARNLLPRFT